MREGVSEGETRKSKREQGSDEGMKEKKKGKRG